MPGRAPGRTFETVTDADYRAAPPVPRLRSVVACEWERRPGPAREVRVLPDGCVDVVWASDGRLFVAGPDLGPVAHRQGDGVGFVGVRLRPGTAATILGVAADELRDQQVSLADLWGGPARPLEERLAEAATGADALRILGDAIKGRIGDGDLDDPVRAAAGTLARGSLSVADVATEVGLSPRQLQRRFVRQVGYGPKAFDRVMRFRRFLAFASAADTGTGLAAIAAASGYADQPHLTRECRELADRTPAQLLAGV